MEIEETIYKILNNISGYGYDSGCNIVFVFDERVKENIIKKLVDTFGENNIVIDNTENQYSPIGEKCNCTIQILLDDTDDIEEEWICHSDTDANNCNEYFNNSNNAIEYANEHFEIDVVIHVDYKNNTEEIIWTKDERKINISEVNNG